MKESEEHYIAKYYFLKKGVNEDGKNEEEDFQLFNYYTSGLKKYTIGILHLSRCQIYISLPINMFTF